MPERPPRILFVCVENSCRSQMAEGFARALSQGRLEASSAGSRPSGRVDPRAIASMKERGVDLTKQRPKGLEDLPAGVIWDCIVTMGCGDSCPHLEAKTRLNWELPDPRTMSDEEFHRVRDEIECLVRNLLELVGRSTVREGRAGEG
ncbi:MAG TPA: arsenate reductase ArsC [Candidatus Polarisedimenticolia bacterium]|nr:arsenate reductase ArsC [Candidatus Polarisedimenticolia bacterium]